MTKIWSLAVLMTMVCLATGLQAEEKPARKPTGQGGGGGQLLSLPPGIELTAEQTSQVDKIRQKYQEQAKELQSKQNQLMTAEQRKARTELMKSAREAGKSPAEIREAAKSLETNYTAEQKEKLDSLRKESQQLRQKFLAEASEVLTAEQKAKLPGGRKNPSAGGKKKSESKT